MSFTTTLLLVLALTACVLVSADCPDDCPATCPDQYSAQSQWVKDNFSLDQFWGTYYELEYHDNTQPSYMSCQRSVKSLNDNGKTYKDLFSLHVFGSTTAVCDLEFDITDKPGVFLGHWAGNKRPDLHNINNTVIDVGVAKNGTYTWVLEFQCADNSTAAAEQGTPSGITFAAINFYHKHPLEDDTVIPAMEERARARGVGWILNSKPGVHVVNQKTCVDHGTYPPVNSDTKMCGQKTDLVDFFGPHSDW